MYQNLRLALPTALATFALIVIPPMLPESMTLGLSGSAQAQKAKSGEVCKAVFAENKTEIERLAAAGDNSGIRAIFARAGCRSVAINVAKQPRALPNVSNPNASNSAARSMAPLKGRLTCTISFPPLRVTCGWGPASA
jgi:hypothetical protein